MPLARPRFGIVFLTGFDWLGVADSQAVSCELYVAGRAPHDADLI